MLLAACACVSVNGSLHAETVEHLKKLLAQKDAELAKKDAAIKALEAKVKKVAAKESPPRRTAANPQTTQVGFNRTPGLQQGFTPRDVSVDPQRQTLNEIENNEDEGARALERTLVREGASILPPYQIQVTPTLTGSYWDPERPTIYRNSIGGSISAAMGLPWKRRFRSPRPSPDCRQLQAIPKRWAISALACRSSCSTKTIRCPTYS